MFNLNIPPSSLLGFEGSSLCSTPKTPEIVNSLIAMSNPMDSYNFSTAALTPGNAVSVRNFTTVSSAQSTSQDSSHSSCSASPLDSPAGIHTTPSVQQTCSQLIKAGLKLSIQSKRKLSTCDSSSGSEQPQSKCSRRDEEYDESTDDDSENKSAPKGLTPEDEDRRRRRRERNKIAATKCRMKKRERTQNLMKESEQLDTQNVDLKNQARALETERRRLLEMLQSHASTCVNQAVFSIPSKLLHSPASKYLAELELELNNSAASMSDDIVSAGTPTNGPQLQQELHKSGNGNNCSKLPPLPPRTVIPPVSTIKFSRSNGMKAVTAVSNASSAMCNVNMTQQVHQLPTHQQLPNGYCKPSPTPQDMGYLNSPAQENICLPSLQPLHGAQTPTTHQAAPAVNHQLADYFPNCDSAMSMRITHASTPTASSGGDSTALLGGVVSPLSAVSTPTTTEFVKNELVDSQSPYTTAQSAERFLFENNCDSFVDIKHAVSVLPGSHSNNSMNSLTNNNNNNLLDFHSSLIGSASSIVPFHDHISMKNDFLHDTDLLGQLTGDASEFVDLDTGVTSAFMTNGGCLA